MILIWPGLSKKVPAGKIRLVPLIAMGTIGRPVSTAARNAPKRNGNKPVLATNVPSGKINNDSSFLRGSRTAAAPSIFLDTLLLSSVM